MCCFRSLYIFIHIFAFQNEKIPKKLKLKRTRVHLICSRQFQPLDVDLEPHHCVLLACGKAAFPNEVSI